MGKPNAMKYDGVAMILHWLIAGLMIFMLFFGEELMEAEHGEVSTLPPTLHVSIGVAILVLTLLRILWRLTHRAPALPAQMTSLERRASKSLHGIFYLLLILLPLTGWLAFPHFLQEEPGLAMVSVFGVFPLPLAPSLGIPAGFIHEVLSKVGIVAVVLHVLAALKHQFFDRDNLLGRMLPL